MPTTTPSRRRRHRTGPERPGGPLSGITVLDLATVGPAARCTRLLADYGATVVKVGAVPGRGAEPLRRPSTPTAARATCGATAHRPQGPRGARRLPGPGPRRPTWWSRASGPAWSTGSGIGYDAAVRGQPADRLLLDHRLRPDGPPRRAGPATTSTTWPSAATWPRTEPRADGGPPVPGATIADAAGGGMQAAHGHHGRADRPGGATARAPTSTCRSPTGCCG